MIFFLGFFTCDIFRTAEVNLLVVENYKILQPLLVFWIGSCTHAVAFTNRNVVYLKLSTECQVS